MSSHDDVTLAGEPELVTKQTRGSRKVEGRLLPGAPVGRYMVLSRVGAGGMGVVYAAYDPELDRKVAIKLLRGVPGKGSFDGQRERRWLKQEAQALAKLAHPNVTAIHDVGEHEGRVFMAMEFIDGLTLGQWLEQRRPSASEILEVFVKAGEGLAAAHEQELVHRDFKPDNVMVGRDGRVRVMDFGLAREATNDAADPSVRAGTPAYMAPEQFLGTGVDARTDQFSFCVALWEALVGRRPYEGETIASLMDAVVEGRRLDAGSTAWAKVPPWVRQALERGLEPEPERRWPSMTPLLHELQRRPDPRRWVWMLGAGGLAVLAGGTAWLARSSEAERCEAPSGSIAGVWDEARRDAVARALRGTGAPHAEATWTRVEAGLDAYATELGEIRHRLCTTPPQDELAGERTVCLDHRTRALGSLAEVLEGADAMVVDEAVDAVTGLPELGRCLDVAYLSAKVAPPEDPVVAERVEALRGRLTRIEAMTIAGKTEEAMEDLQPVREAAEPLGYEPLTGEIDLAAARVRARRGQTKESSELARAAFEHLLAVGEDEAAAAAAKLLVAQLGDRQGRTEEGLGWVAPARALARRAELGLGFEADLRMAVANVQLAAGGLDAAEQELHRVLELRERLYGPEHSTIYPAALGLGSVYAQRGEIDHAFEPVERALRIAERALGPEHPDIGAIVLNLGNLYVEAGDLERARSLYARSLAITEGVRGPMHPQLVLVLNNLGTVEQRQGDLRRSLATLQRALSVAEATDGPKSPNAALTLTNLALVQQRLDQPEQAEASARRAVEIWEQRVGPELVHPHAASALNNLGSALSTQGQLDAAHEALERSLQAWEQLAGPEHPALIDPLRGLVMVELRRGEAEVARVAAERMLALQRAAGASDEELAFTEAAIARARLSLGGDREAALSEIRAARQRLARATAPERVAERDQIDQWQLELDPASDR
ncbi:MAG: serine/threonine protein kinase [Myxococcales bacterium]|nr:serine/threonine protein kinase [Myxococcales bacterium]